MALAQRNYIDLPRSRDENYACRFPTEIHTARERLRRKEGGELYEAWRSDPDAMGLAQPSVGNKYIKVPDSFADGIDINPAVDVLRDYSERNAVEAEAAEAEEDAEMDDGFSSYLGSDERKAWAGEEDDADSMDDG